MAANLTVADALRMGLPIPPELLGPNSPLREQRVDLAAAAGVGAGGSSRKGARQREHAEQVRVVNWARGQWATWPELCGLYAVPNGVATSKGQARKLKAEGLRRGMTDLVLPAPLHGYAGCYLEVKADTETRRATSNVRTERYQRWWARWLVALGYYHARATSADEAIATLEQYLRGRVPAAPPRATRAELRALVAEYEALRDEDAKDGTRRPASLLALARRGASVPNAPNAPFSLGARGRAPATLEPPARAPRAPRRGRKPRG